MNYIDLALCEGANGELTVFQAPEFSLNENDKVILETNFNNLALFNVIDVLSLDPNSEEYKFIKFCLDNKEPYKLYGKVIIKPFDYKDGDDYDKG